MPQFSLLLSACLALAGLGREADNRQSGSVRKSDLYLLITTSFFFYFSVNGRYGSRFNVSIDVFKEPEGPPVVGKSDSLGFQKIASEPQPPSTHGLFGPHIKAPAPPPPGEGPQPPAAPDPYLLEIFEKSPDTFPAAYIEWQQQQQGDEDNEREGRATKRRSFTYDQFVTAAVVARLDIQRSVYTMFAPSDAYLKSLNISLSAMALKDPECVGQIVR